MPKRSSSIPTLDQYGGKQTLGKVAKPRIWRVRRGDDILERSAADLTSRNSVNSRKIATSVQVCLDNVTNEGTLIEMSNGGLEPPNVSAVTSH